MRFPALFRLAVLIACALASPVYGQPDYWQQHVATKIDVRLDDSAHFLRGSIEMTYTNHSPDTLRFIYMHLYPNAYQTDRTAYEKQAVANGQVAHYFSKEKDRGFIDSLDFRVNDRVATLMATEAIDIGKLLLQEPLPPGDSILIATPFRVKIPRTFSRLGHSGQSYQISQWFPKPAVYDARGWHPLPYLDQGEFYSEFGSYDVTITIPENYVVMATGNLIDAPAEMRRLDSLAALPLPSDTLFQHTTPPSAPDMKTLRFRESHVHDFAWFADKRWVVRKDTIRDESFGHPVVAYRCFFPWHQSGWKNSAEAVAAAMKSYSRQVGAYPYHTVKVVEGALSAGGGMEYPTVAIVAAGNQSDLVRTTIIHEVGHNWFYGMLASNERDHPWLDEGINSYYEHRLDEPAHRRSFFATGMAGRNLDYLAYASISATHGLLPADTAATYYPMINYGVDIYNKVPLFLAWLADYMGESEFDAAMQAYFRTYRFKHPQPEDFERIFRAHSTKPIDWFFDALHTGLPVDYALGGMSRRGDSTILPIKNKTGFAGPVKVELNGKRKDGQPVVRSMWVQPFDKATELAIPSADSLNWEWARISSVVPDFNPQNNSSRAGHRLGAVLGPNLAARHTHWLSPAIGYNYYDGFMAGLVLHNLTLPTNRFQYAWAPLYGFSSRRPVGTGFFSYDWYFDEGWLHRAQGKIEAKVFDYRKSDLNVSRPVAANYMKVAPSVEFWLRRPEPRSTVVRWFTLKGYWVREEQLAFDLGADGAYRPARRGFEDMFYGKLRYDYQNIRTFNPFSYGLEGQVGADFAKMSVEGKLRIDYYLRRKGLDLRGYIGKLVYFSSGADMRSNRYALAMTFTGENDYLYDHTFFARGENSGFASRQIVLREGGFKAVTRQYAQPVGESDNWLMALNATTDLPLGKIPLRLFADIAAFPATDETAYGPEIVYEAGIELRLGEVGSFYLPLLLSPQLDDYAKSVLGKNRLLKMISFQINFNRIPWDNLSRVLWRTK